MLSLLDQRLIRTSCHCQRIVRNLIFSWCIGCYLNDFLTWEIILPIRSIVRSNGNLDFPWFSGCIFQGDFILSDRPDNSWKFNILDRLDRLRYAFSKKINMQRLGSFDETWNIIESDILINNFRVECYCEEGIFMRR